MFKLIYRESLYDCKTIYCDDYEEAIEYCKILAKDNKSFKLYNNCDLIAESKYFTFKYPNNRYYTYIHFTDKERKYRKKGYSR